jgi:hypothetical protein
MAKHTQAHLTRTVDRTAPDYAKDLTKKKMEYYMGAKLLEIGVEPSATVYRWTTEIKGTKEVYTCSAYWGDSKTRILQEEGTL